MMLKANHQQGPRSLKGAKAEETLLSGSELEKESSHHLDARAEVALVFSRLGLVEVFLDGHKRYFFALLMFAIALQYLFPVADFLSRVVGRRSARGFYLFVRLAMDLAILRFFSTMAPPLAQGFLAVCLALLWLIEFSLPFWPRWILRKVPESPEEEKEMQAQVRYSKAATDLYYLKGLAEGGKAFVPADILKLAENYRTSSPRRAVLYELSFRLTDGQETAEDLREDLLEALTLNPQELRQRIRQATQTSAATMARKPSLRKASCRRI